MNTKETIEKINKAGYIDIEFRGEIIEVLQRGEKCCKIIEKLRNIDANITIFSKSDETISMTALDVYLDEIKKKP